MTNRHGSDRAQVVQPDQHILQINGVTARIGKFELEFEEQILPQNAVKKDPRASNLGSGSVGVERIVDFVGRVDGCPVGLDSTAKRQTESTVFAIEVESVVPVEIPVIGCRLFGRRRSADRRGVLVRHCGCRPGTNEEYGHQHRRRGESEMGVHRPLSSGRVRG